MSSDRRIGCETVEVAVEVRKVRGVKFSGARGRLEATFGWRVGGAVAGVGRNALWTAKRRETNVDIDKRLD